MLTTEERTDPNRLLTPEEAATLLAVQIPTLAKWRETGRVALPFIKLSRNVVRYRYRDVVNFIGERTASNTVQARNLGAA